MPTEKELVTSAAAGNREAFDELARACRPWLLGLCFRMVRDQATAQDLVQETLLRAFRDLPQLDSARRFRAWLSRVAVNTVRMHLRRQRSRPEELPLGDEIPEGTRAAQDTALEVEEALARLDPAQRRMLLLFHGEELSHTEIAELLSLSAAAVKSRLHRYREKLRKEILTMMTDDQKARLGVAEEQPWHLHTILVVERDPSLLASLQKELTAAGYEVVVLPTGEAALFAAREHRGQLLILDKHCGEPHWTEVLMLLQVDAWSRENLPVGVLVDRGNERDALLAWQGGAAFCLTRPFDTSELIDLVGRVAAAGPQ